MGQRTKTIILLVFGAAAIYGGGLALEQALFPSVTYRYRMTVSVDTPQGVRSGSSVIESTVSDGMRFGDASGISYGLKGEAVAVDIADGQTLFALLSNGSDAAAYQARLIHTALAEGAVAVPPLPRRYAANEWVKERKAIKQIEPSVVLPVNSYPLLVLFGDRNNPKTIETVKPGDLEAFFGPGVALKSISLKVTEDPVSKGVKKRIPRPDAKGFLNWDGRSNPSLPGVYSISDFIEQDAGG